MKYLEDLLFWIREREAIRIQKDVQRLPRPWTKDPVLNAYRFCNIRRENDKVTRWIKQYWRDPNKNHPNLAFGMCVARMVNWPDTLMLLGFPKVWDSQEFIDVIGSIKRAGKKAWTGAYMVTGGYSKGGETKEVIIARVLDSAVGPAGSITSADTLASAASKLSQVRGMGTFLGAQVIADLKNTRLLSNATDWWEWCAPGPGSTMGLNFLHERARANPIRPNRFLSEVNELRPLVKNETGEDLCAQDMQNCLCEFSKYVRAKHFKEKLKTTYETSEEPLGGVGRPGQAEVPTDR
jgi:hypothetical protein